jgi:hypothetical protein
MKTEHGIRRKFGYALGFALAAGIALTTTLIAHAPQAEAATECPIGDVCPPRCNFDITCGPVDNTTITGFFVKQKPDLACVYQCSGEETCTEQDEDCSTSTFTSTVSFRRRLFYPAGACPMDDASATSACMTGQPTE